MKVSVIPPIEGLDKVDFHAGNWLEKTNLPKHLVVRATA